MLIDIQYLHKRLCPAGKVDLMGKRRFPVLPVDLHMGSTNQIVSLKIDKNFLQEELKLQLLQNSKSGELTLYDNRYKSSMQEPIREGRKS